MNRRSFLEKSVLGTAAFGIPTLVPARVFGPYAPSNRITVGVIGTGRQSMGLNLPGFFALPDAQVVAVCDVDRWRLAEAKKFVEAHYAKGTHSGQYAGCATTGDFREILSRKDIDAVMIATPDHWHVPMGILAARAGKHISCEKPLSLSVGQGRALAEAVKRYAVINRTDSEFRSVRQQNRAVELVRNGRIGTLRRIDISFPSDPPPVPPQPDMPVPKDLDYAMWLGPAPEVPYTEMRVHTPFDVKKRPNWMRIDTYAQGMIANWGAHYFDLAQWANQSEQSGPVEVEGRGEFPRGLWNTMINFEIRYRYANGVELSCRQTPTSTPSIRYTGSEGWIFVEGYPGNLSASNPAVLDSKPARGELDLSNVLTDKGDFIQAIKRNTPTLEPIEVGHRTISIAQIGLIACQVGASTPGGKLTWNPEKELFQNNNAANALLAEPLARKEWTV